MQVWASQFRCTRKSFWASIQNSNRTHRHLFIFRFQIVQETTFQFSISLIVRVLSRFIRKCFEIPQESPRWGREEGVGERELFFLMVSRKVGRSWNRAGLCHISGPIVKPEVVWLTIRMWGRFFESSFIA